MSKQLVQGKVQIAGNKNHEMVIKEGFNCVPDVALLQKSLQFQVNLK